MNVEPHSKRWARSRIVFEAIPAVVTELVIAQLEIPVIGIGAGPAADSKVLVFHDPIGIYDGHVARFVKRYRDVRAQMAARVAESPPRFEAVRSPLTSTPTRIDERELEQFKA